MDSEISRGRGKGTIGKESAGKAAEADGKATAMDIQNGYGKESVAIAVSFCPMDTGNG